MKVPAHANHLAYAEEIGRSGEALGAFPQALTLTHLALISAATNLDHTLGGTS